MRPSWKISHDGVSVQLELNTVVDQKKLVGGQCVMPVIQTVTVLTQTQQKAREMSNLILTSPWP
jgi:hypothetical protein